MNDNIARHLATLQGNQEPSIYRLTVLTSEGILDTVLTEDWSDVVEQIGNYNDSEYVMVIETMATS